MNPKTVKKYSSLAYRKYRDKWGLFLAEGYHIVEELLNSDWRIEAILTSKKEMFEKLQGGQKADRIELVKPDVINKIATTKSPQDILAAVKIPELPPPDISGLKRIIIADGIKDPGNLGTIIRTARAFDYDLIITTENSADIYNPKVVRATQGALFGIGALPGLPAGKIAGKLKSSHKIYALMPEGDILIDKIKPAGKSALIIGMEIEGVSSALQRICDYSIKIPQSRHVESLNAAVAAGIAMYIFSSGS